MFRRLLERWWALVVLAFAVATLATGWFLPQVTVDAGTNLLLDEHDPDLTYYAKSRRQWPSDDEFAIVCCRRADWFTADGLKLLRAVQTDLTDASVVPHVKKSLSLLDIPLLRNGGSPLSPPTIESPSIDLAKARDELTHHAVAKGTFISQDGLDAVFLVYLDQPPDYEKLDRERNQALEDGDDAKVAELEPAYEVQRGELRARRRAMVDGVRAVAAKWAPKMEGPIRLSGLPLINLSLIEFVSHDVNVFGVASFVLFVLGFAGVYRTFRWTFFPILACLLPVVLVLGALGLLVSYPQLLHALPEWISRKFSGKLTVITANLPLLLFVVMLPYTVYFVERYRERRAKGTGEDHLTTTAGAAGDIWLPCLYSCTTTMAGFASLLTSGVKPVWSFGLLMTIGLAVGLACAFLFLPAATAPLKPVEDPKAVADPQPAAFVRTLERSVLRVPALLIAAGVALYVVGAIACLSLTVENKFIDYFKPTSEVYLGLEYIDQHMGGTTPLDVVLTSKTPGFFKTKDGVAAIRSASEFVSTKVAEVGSVTSLATLVDEARKSPFLARATDAAVLGMGESQPKLRPLLRDVATADYSTTRILVRFRETAPTLRRKAILDGLRADLAEREKADLAGLAPRITGVFLLYSNMLEALLQSQKDTFWAVILSISLMLMTLFGLKRTAVKVPVAVALSVVLFIELPPPFKIDIDLLGIVVASAAVVSLALALAVRIDEKLETRGFRRLGALVHTLALSLVVHLPQILPAVVVLGVMGWTGVPLDLITVTIAAIAMGVGIDSSIQYTVRYRLELEATGGDRRAAVTRSHATIGRSIWIATSIMVVGFLVMAFSDFVPTVYFGVFNALAMVMGQLATLTVLPALFLVTGLPRR
jgi:predicted RND superfamily exporter protein